MNRVQPKETLTGFRVSQDVGLNDHQPETDRSQG